MVGFWGTRGSVSTPGRRTERYGGNTPCVSVRTHDTCLVFDAGTGVRSLGIDLEHEWSQRNDALVVHLFLSHTHWDHIQGIPFFGPAYRPGTRLIIYGSVSKHGFLEQVLRGQMNEDYFPLSMSDFDAELSIHELQETELHIDDLTVCWQEQLYHPGGSVRYRVERNGKRVVYASDVELNRFFAADADAPQKEHQQAYMDFIAGADLLVADGQFTAEEYSKRQGYGHTSMELLTDVASRAGVHKLAVFHHDPQRTDRQIEELWQGFRHECLAKTPPFNVFWAREGLIVPV